MVEPSFSLADESEKTTPLFSQYIRHWSRNDQNNKDNDVIAFRKSFNKLKLIVNEEIKQIHMNLDIFLGFRDLLVAYIRSDMLNCNKSE